MPSNKKANIISALLDCGVGRYLVSMQRHISAGDSGELASAVCSSAAGRPLIAHPPGYPLFSLVYTMCWRLWVAFVPSAKPVVVLNAVSAFISSLAVTLLYHAVRLAGPTPRLLAASVALSFAFSNSVWTYAAQVEVFALNNLFSCGLLLLAVHIFRCRSSGCVSATRLAAFVSGLALW